MDSSLQGLFCILLLRCSATPVAILRTSALILKTSALIRPRIDFHWFMLSECSVHHCVIFGKRLVSTVGHQNIQLA
ncbi:hypothetical protein B0H17DRAFT_1095917 [Mycena rosella]|uniref:Secreted protein n=1 Tax=Mycena rosella TaxID=1033263 RepID=A0AAD7CSE4_MYCRO|nr:hypothetical protein B0H17DRAFT_1095917 [Mycena rosella]